MKNLNLTTDQKIKIANIKQELLSPAEIIYSYSELLLQNFKNKNLKDEITDCENIITASYDKSKCKFDDLVRYLQQYSLEILDIVTDDADLADVFIRNYIDKTINKDYFLNSKKQKCVKNHWIFL